MSASTFAKVAVFSLVLGACGGESPGADQPSASAVPAGLSAAPSGSAPALTTATVAPPPAVAPIAPVPATFAKLPSAAAVYFLVRPAAVDRMIESSTGNKTALGQLLTAAISDVHLHSKTLPADAGVDPARAIVGAVTGTPEKNARAVVEAVVQGKKKEELLKLIHEHAGVDAIHFRFLVPLTPGADPVKVAEVLADHIGERATLDACPASKLCDAFGSDPPLAIHAEPGVFVAVFADGSDLDIEATIPLFRVDSGAVPAAATAFRNQRGGIGAACNTLDGLAPLALCIDTAHSGDLAAITDDVNTMGDVSGAGLDTEQRKKIAARGVELSKIVSVFGAPRSRLASDGTVAVRESSVVASWALTDANKAAVGKLFESERCYRGDAWLTELAPALRGAFGDPGPEFKDGKRSLKDFKQGHGTWLLPLVGGSWANLVGGVQDTAKKGESPLPEGLQLCARIEAGRLRLEVK